MSTERGHSIRLAKTAGFCFGVDRAVKMVYAQVDAGKRVATLGPIIHNPQVVDDLRRRGVRILRQPSEAEAGETVVLRSHGVAQEVCDALTAAGIPYLDATCPFVAKIHRIVKEAAAEGKTILIAGDASHPEVEGILGHCSGQGIVVADAKALEALYPKLTETQRNHCVLVAQTTYRILFWEKCREIAKKLYTNAKIFDTICGATDARQRETESLAQESDLMVVVGGRDSSNTRKLAELSARYCETRLVETADGLSTTDLSNFARIAVTAGASTPAHIIKEVLKTMSEILRQEENEMDFATMLEQSLESEKIYNGKRVKGVVTSFNNSEVHVDIGAKQAGIVPVSELSDDPNFKVEDIVKKGDEIELAVVKVNDQEGIVTLSKKRCDAALGFEKLKAAYEEGTVLDGVVSDVVRGGVLVFTQNTKLFVPASLCSDSRVENLETLLKKPVQLKVTEINEARGRAKGSIRAVLMAQRKEQQAKFWEEVAVDKKYTGAVKSLTSYGAFVDLGGIDGMIHITELSWSKIKHPSEVVKVGDVVDVYVKEFDPEKKRISLGYKSMDENPWTVFADKYQVGDVVSVKVVSFTNYGAFAEIIPGVDGLIHISQIANKRVEKVADMLKIGEVVDAKIIEIDMDKKRVSLSMRALLSEEEQKKEREILDEAAAAGIQVTEE